MMKTPDRPLFRVHPSAFLLAAQLLFLVLYAVFDGVRIERAILSTFGIIVLMLRVWVINRSPGTDWIAWMLAVPALILSVVSAFVDSTPLVVISSVIDAALYFYAAASLIAYMMSDNVVTTDELFAAAATFTLIAWGFAFLYFVMQIVWPGSFIGTSSAAQPQTFIEMLFLSFTNLSATGLSDILPASTSARVLVMFEQLAGVGYVAVVVSRLVGLTIQRERQSRQED